MDIYEHHQLGENVYVEGLWKQAATVVGIAEDGWPRVMFAGGRVETLHPWIVRRDPWNVVTTR